MAISNSPGVPSKLTQSNPSTHNKQIEAKTLKHTHSHRQNDHTLKIEWTLIVSLILIWNGIILNAVGLEWFTFWNEHI